MPIGEARNPARKHFVVARFRRHRKKTMRGRGSRNPASVGRNRHFKYPAPRVERRIGDAHPTPRRHQIEPSRALPEMVEPSLQPVTAKDDSVPAWLAHGAYFADAFGTTPSLFIHDAICGCSTLIPATSRVSKARLIRH